MSDQPNKPMLSDKDIRNEVIQTVRATPNRTMDVMKLPLSAYEVRDLYEAERAKLLAEIAKLRAVTVEQIMEVVGWMCIDEGQLNAFRERLTKLFNP